MVVDRPRTENAHQGQDRRWACICMFLIDVMEGRAEGANVGHRVSAAKELLNRAFGKSQSRDLPKPPGSKASTRSTGMTRRKHAITPEAAAAEARVDTRVATGRPAPYSDTGTTQAESTHQLDPEANGDPEDPDFNPNDYHY